MSNDNLPRKILFIDDDPSVVGAIEPALQKRNIKLVKTLDSQSAIYQFNQQKFDVVIIELELNGVPGTSLAQKFRSHDNRERRETAIIIMAGQARKATDDALITEIGNIEVIDKPITEIKLLPFLTRAMDRRKIGVEFESARTLAYKLFEATGDVDRAISSLEGRLAGQEMERVGLVCQLLEEAKRYKDAEALVDKMLEQHPDNLKLINTKGRILLRSGQLDQAKAHLEKLDKIAPANLERIEAMAKMYIDLKQPDAAVGKMKQVIAHNPDEPDKKFEMLEALDHAGFTEHAVGLCKETVQPKEVVRYYNNKGVSVAKKGESDKALRDYYVALVYYPKYKDNYKILFNIAIAEAKKRTPEGTSAAIKALQKCLELAPEFEKARLLLEKLNETRKAS